MVFLKFEQSSLKICNNPWISKIYAMKTIIHIEILLTFIAKIFHFKFNYSILKNLYFYIYRYFCIFTYRNIFESIQYKKTLLQINVYNF